MRPAVFFDRDGTLTEEIGYVNHPSRLKLLPHSVEAVRAVHSMGWLAVLVTNQAGVARGYMTEDVVRLTMKRFKELLASGDEALDGIYYCPHLPTARVEAYRKDCRCRKPLPGMLEQAASELGIDLGRSVMVGDKYFSDIVMAHQIKMAGVFVLTGYGLGEREYQSSTWPRQPEHVAEDALDAVRWVAKNRA
jgi:D-glycero-D-manno-heptose 1,7-bisphosphate phosphatase